MTERERERGGGDVVFPSGPLDYSGFRTELSLLLSAVSAKTVLDARGREQPGWTNTHMKTILVRTYLSHQTFSLLSLQKVRI